MRAREHVDIEPYSHSREYTTLLKAKHEIHVRQSDDSAPCDVEKSEIGRELFADEADAEGVDEIILGSRKQIILRDEGNSPRDPLFSAEHSDWLALDISAGEAVAQSHRDARVAIAERARPIAHAACASLCARHEQAG